MSKPSNLLQRPSPIVVKRQKNKKITCLEDHLTRQLSNFSNEAYDVGQSASVPFVWESQPGTPKVRLRENSLPPLTPPPSYFKNATENPTIKDKKNSPKASFLQTIFPKRTTRKSCVIPPPRESPSFSNSSSSSSSSLSSSSSMRPTSYSVPSSPMVHSRKVEEDDENLYDVPGNSSLCFGNARSRGCYSSMFKKVLLGDFV
ncbi:uncharacterized protein LOC133310449 [Gastrolobium bilobum]|uniref:uncharacterized protein LOC133310449 n=1 Tax=Gastrolobium bilobum TaxID=150636 RepID=UPI002AB0CD85|nr:uncharacterized protein LOC133310449 [Gastrolobium bilobum]